MFINTITTITMSSSTILIIINKVIAYFDLVGQEQADGLQALLSSEKETSSIIFLELTDGVDDDDVDDKVDEDCVENLST